MGNEEGPFDERQFSQDVWRLISTVLEIPESRESAHDYWDDVRQGTCLLLGIVLKLANELDNHAQVSDGVERQPRMLQHLIHQVQQHEDEIKDAWLRLLV